MSRPVAVLLMLLATAIWGLAFVSQKSAMESMGPLTFSAARLWLGTLALSPLAIWEYRRKRRNGPALTGRNWGLIALLSGVFLGASLLQQYGLLYTTVTNGGFLTALYVLFVPHDRLGGAAPPPAPGHLCRRTAGADRHLLLNGGLDAFNIGDVLLIISAVFWGGHVFMVGLLARGTGLPVTISALSFGLTALPITILCLIFETPTLAGMANGWVQIAYAGLLSTGVAYTLQAVGQQHVPASNAAIILSSESLFAALAGALILNERLSLLGYAGAALIFCAIILVEAVPALNARRAPPAAI